MTMGESRMNKFDEIDVEEDDGTDGNSSEEHSDEGPRGNRDEDDERLRDRKAIAMYLPDEVREELTRIWHQFASKNPNAQKNKDYFTEIVKRGLESMKDDV